MHAVYSCSCAQAHLVQMACFCFLPTCLTCTSALPGGDAPGTPGEMWCRALTSGRRRHQCSTSRTGVLLAVASFQLARRALEMAQCRPEQPVRRHCRRDSGIIGRAVQHPSPLCVWWHRCMMSCKPCWVHRLKSRFFLADKGGQAFPVGMPPKVHAWRRSWHDYVGAA